MTKPAGDIHYLYTLAGQNFEAGKLKEAAEIYGRILAQDPAHAESLYMLGLIFIRIGNLDRAETLLATAIAGNPERPHLYHKMMGDVLRQAGRSDEAITRYMHAINLEPDYVEALNNLASMLLMDGDGRAAKDYYGRILRLRPQYIPALYNMAAIVRGEGDLSEASRLLEELLLHKPDHADAWKALSDVLLTSGKVDGAIDARRHSVLLAPDAMGHATLAALLSGKKDYQAAIEEFKRAIALDQNCVEAISSLGALYVTFEKYEEALLYCRRAYELQPDNSSVLNNLANAYKGTGKLDEAISYYKKALVIAPEDYRIYANLLLAMIYSSSVAPQDIADSAFRFGSVLSKNIPRMALKPCERNPEKKLKIGYVSPDFRRHSVNYFFEHLLINHTREDFEVFGYSNVRNPDAVTDRLRANFDHWRDIHDVDDDKAADLIAADGIDILVDMAGHTANNRLPVFSRKPAPVQVTWLGYPATTGMDTINYRITDNFAEPEGMTEGLNAETLWRLPHMFCCFSPNGSIAEVIDHPPCEDNGYITFGCINTITKVTDPVLACWKRIVDAVPGSKLFLEVVGIDVHKAFRDELLARLKAAGFSEDQLILEPRRAENQFVIYNRMDIALDPFPCNGGTTSMDALWMGVPLVTLSGTHFVARMGTSILSNAGLPDLIARTVDEYVTKATELALDRARLNSVRNGLRQRVEKSPVMDQEIFVHDMEAAYRQMWRLFCEKEA